MLKTLLGNTSINPVVVSHRGCSIQENKIDGFANGVRMGCKLLECDVRLSKDRNPVVIHDKTIDRTTCGTGAVKNMTASQLSEYDIPSFEELVDWCLRQEDICLAVEIKDVGRTRNDDLLSKVMSVIQDRNVLDRCILISFNRHILTKAKTTEPNILTGLLYGPLLLNCPFYLREKVLADYLLVHHSIIDSYFAKRARKTNTPLFAWTVNEEKDIEKILSLNIDGIITDYPSIVRSAHAAFITLNTSLQSF